MLLRIPCGNRELIFKATFKGCFNIKCESFFCLGRLNSMIKILLYCSDRNPNKLVLNETSLNHVCNQEFQDGGVLFKNTIDSKIYIYILYIYNYII